MLRPVYYEIGLGAWIPFSQKLLDWRDSGDTEGENKYDDFFSLVGSWSSECDISFMFDENFLCIYILVLDVGKIFEQFVMQECFTGSKGAVPEGLPEDRCLRMSLAEHFDELYQSGLPKALAQWPKICEKAKEYDLVLPSDPYKIEILSSAS